MAVHTLGDFKGLQTEEYGYHLSVKIIPQWY